MGLNLSAYRPEFVDIQPGETKRVNHTDCVAGVDSRRRLYLTRPASDPAKIIAYCHNCQQGGMWNGGQFVNYRDIKHVAPLVGPTVLPVVDFRPPSHMLTDILDWPVHATAWAFKSGLSSDLCKLYAIQYDPTSNRVYLPRYQYTSSKKDPIRDLRGYQLRNTDPALNVPKYTTVVADTDKGYTMMYGTASSSGIDLSHKPIVVVVEDLCSGIQVIEAFRKDPRTVHCVVNYGTKVNLEALFHASRYNNVLIWLDNDSGHVSEQAHIMGRTVSLLNSNVVVMTEMTQQDPKHYPQSGIRRTVTEGGDWL